MYKLIDHLAAEDSISTFVIMSLVLELGTKIILIFENGFDLCGLVFSKRPDPVLYIRKDGPVGPILSYIRFLCCQAL